MPLNHEPNPSSLSKSSSSPHPARHCFSFLLSLYSLFILNLADNTHISAWHGLCECHSWCYRSITGDVHWDEHCLTADNAGTGLHILLQPLTQPLNWQARSFWHILLPTTEAGKVCQEIQHWMLHPVYIFDPSESDRLLHPDSFIHGLDAFQSYK